MRGHHVTKPRRVDRAKKLGRGFVVQMPEPARDALLERHRVVTVLEHAEIVVAFEHERVAARKARLDVTRRHADVGQHAEPLRAIADDELDRLARIVRHRKWPHLHHADRKHVMAVEAEHPRQPGNALARHRQRPERAPYRDAEAACERSDAADVIGVLVRDDDRADRIGRHAEAPKAHDRVAHPEPAVDQDARITDFDDERVAFAAAAQGGEAHARRTRRYLSWSRRSARMRSDAGDLSGLPVVSWTTTVLFGALSATLMRYCSGLSLSSSLRNTLMNFDRNPFCRSSFAISVSGSAKRT